MSLQRFNTRAKKSLPGLYTSDDANGYSPPSRSSAAHDDQSPYTDIEDCKFEEFGPRLARCSGSPSGNSVSMRKRLGETLRNFRSVANLHSSPIKAKQAQVERAESPVNCAGSALTVPPMSPSLALLDFQKSPSDKPIFDLSLHERSVSGSSPEVQHSSPVVVPGAARQPTSYQLAPSAVDLPTGTLPDTPGPMQRAFNRDPANHLCRGNADPTPLERYAPSTPILTPLPGTNMSIDDVDPELVPLPPSLNPSTLQLSQEEPGYFDIPVSEQQHMDMADELHGLAHLRLNADKGDCISQDLGGTGTSNSRSARGRAGLAGFPVQTVAKSRDAKSLDNRVTLHVQQQYAQAHRRKQQAEAFDNAVRALKCSQSRQVLPNRAKKSGKDINSHNRNNSVISGDWQTCSGGYSFDTTSALMHGSPKQFKGTEHLASSTTTTLSERSGMTKSSSASPVNFSSIIWDSPREQRRLGTTHKSIWAENTGLYDGSGYGNGGSDFTTPGELDEGTEHVHMRHHSRLDELTPASLSNEGGSPDEELSTRRKTRNDPYSARVRELSSLPDEEQQDDASLEFIYRAYA